MVPSLKTSTAVRAEGKQGHTFCFCNVAHHPFPWRCRRRRVSMATASALEGLPPMQRRDSMARKMTKMFKRPDAHADFLTSSRFALDLIKVWVMNGALDASHGLDEKFASAESALDCSRMSSFTVCDVDPGPPGRDTVPRFRWSYEKVRLFGSSIRKIFVGVACKHHYGKATAK